jgi:hypothetical protein
VESVETGGINVFLNKPVILWVKESDLPKPKPKYGELVGYDNSHFYIKFNRGPLTGQIKGYHRDTIHRIDLDRGGQY